jgi:cation diffusion facilitator family transporter
MSHSARYEFPRHLQPARDRVRRVAWLSIGLLTSAAMLLAATLGNSQAMKTAWVSDVLTAIPPMALLAAMRLETHPPTRRFPFGYTRAISIAFLVTAAVLTVVGLTLAADAVLKLGRAERPPIGLIVVLGHPIWAGWPMILALGYSLTCGMLIGRLKTPLAERLHDKELAAEAEMNRDEWLSEGSAILGILLVGCGLWWADALAALVISVLMIKDGWHNVRQVIGDLMDEAPTVMGSHELEDLPARVQQGAEALPWVTLAAVRLREHGRVIVGEIFVVPAESAELPRRVEEAAETLKALDWRLHTLTVMPVTRLPDPEATRAA